MTEKLLLTGARGQLGNTFQLHWPESPLATKYQLECCDIQEVDLTNAAAAENYLDRVSPSLVVNAAAYTAVDGAESDNEQAFAVNKHAVENLVTWCSIHDAKIIQISTDFVFSGEADTPYKPDAPTGPLSVYGESKLAGEQALLEKLTQNSVILRTSWLYSEYGNNFVKTMLRLMNERTELGIVCDQIGSPTSAHSLTKAILKIIESKVTGVFHWSDGAAISWYDFATEIQHAGLSHGLLNKAIPLKKLSTKEYPTPAQRPTYSVLDRSESLDLFDGTPNSWQEELHSVVRKLANI